MNTDEDVDLLIRTGFMYPMTPGLPVITGAEVAISGSRIRYAGPVKPSGHWKPRRILDRPHAAMLPGFVNAHCHTASIVFRSQTDDGSGGVGLAGIAFRMERDISDDDWRALAELGCADMLRAGVTTLNDIWYAPWHLADAVARCGLRAQIAHKIFDVRLELLHQGDYTRHTDIGAARLRDAVDFAERWHGAADDRITARIGTHATDTCSAALHREARAEATRLGIGMHIHTAQTRAEVAHIQQQHGCGPLEYLRDIGLLAPDVVCAHLSFASDGDLAAVSETGARYAHCPTIYPRRGRYPALDVIRARGIATGFGTDWMQNDPFEGMRNAINVMRARLGDADYLPCGEALWLHTLGAAQALGIDDQVGSLEEGKQADLILVDLDRPHLQPYYGDHAALVFYARASDVTTSVIAGRIVLEEGRPLHLDERAALDDVARRRSGWAARLRALGSRCVCCG